MIKKQLKIENCQKNKKSFFEFDIFANRNFQIYVKKNQKSMKTTLENEKNGQKIIIFSYRRVGGATGCEQQGFEQQ